METKSLDSIQFNPKNPRQISKQDFDSLKRSLLRFGDLSGIVENRRTGQLVGGHMRSRAFQSLPGEKNITITQTFDQPNKQGTVAIGYVDFDGERWGYRLVDWDEGTEKSAGIAANRIEGSWDLDLLAEVTHELSQLEDQSLLMDTGQTEDEINRLLKSVGAIQEPEQDQSQDEPEKLSFRLTREQREIVEEALGNVIATHDMQTDERSSRNGNALYYMSREYLDRLHGLVDSEPQPQPDPNPQVAQSPDPGIERTEPPQPAEIMPEQQNEPSTI